jgi:hypothetical protein
MARGHSKTVTYAVVGSGVVGTRVVQHLTSLGLAPALYSHKQRSELLSKSVVVLACARPHTQLATMLIDEGISVVSVSDNVSDIMDLLALHDRAVSHNARLVPGAACVPGMSGLLVSHVAKAFDVMDEVHVAVHGTGGPSCAREHHDSLSGRAFGWHDGEWIERPSGSGRELCWFPDPIDAKDCYRYASAEPMLLQRIAPSLQRITARVSATRRDRLTAHLPMLSPPHAEGGVGGLRVEARGSRNGVRHNEIVGMAEKVASVAAAVAAHTAVRVGDCAPGVHVLGESTLPNADILTAVLASGLTLHQFVGHE